jgi:hypothetical protein
MPPIPCTCTQVQMGLRHYHHGRGCALCSVNRLGIHQHCRASRLGCFRDDGSVSWGSSTRATLLAVWRSRHCIRATSWTKIMGLFAFRAHDGQIAPGMNKGYVRSLFCRILMPLASTVSSLILRRLAPGDLDGVFTNTSSSCDPSSVSSPRIQLS